MKKLKWLLLGVLAAGMLSIAACGDDDDDDDDGGDATAEETEAEAEGDGGGEGGLVEVTGVEYEFQFEEGAITTETTGITFINAGEEEHELVLFAVEEDVDIEAALAEETDALPEGVTPAGGTGALAGASAELTFQAPLTAGRYVMLCFIEAEDGEPHFSKGMVADITVE